MQTVWINKANKDNLIVFFNGWGMSEKNIKYTDYSLICFYDYRNLQCENVFSEIKTYKNIYVVGWSMGVLISSLFIDIINPKKRIAIAGTLKPIDNKYGIPEKIYNLTVNNFDDKSKMKFVKRMGACSISDRNTSELKNELISIQQISAKDTYYDKAIIPMNDKIIPAKNQINFWSERNTKIEKIDSEHYPDISWDEILQC